MNAAARQRRRPGWWIVVALLVIVPLAEIYVLIQVGQVIGAWWTILLLVLDSLVGGWLIRREGGRAWQALTTAMDSGRMPTRQLADGALILIGGTLMLSPGFVTDAFGILLILPLTRPVARHLLTRVVSRRLLGSTGSPFTPGTGSQDKRPGPGSNGSVVQGEVVDDED